MNVDFREFLNIVTYCRPHLLGKIYIALRISKLSGSNFCAKIP